MAARNLPVALVLIAVILALAWPGYRGRHWLGFR